MRLQLVGPMTGLPQFNYPAFNAAAAELRAAGFQVWNPADCGLGPHPRGWYMRQSLGALPHADAVVLLPGWEASAGARLEVHTALALDTPVIPLAAFWTLALEP